MPLRVYQCQDCSKSWEEFIRTKDDIPDACIYCNSDKIQNQITTPGGYTISGSNSASTRPKSAGSFKRGGK